jgi:hypothetical protein
MPDALSPCAPIRTNLTIRHRPHPRLHTEAIAHLGARSLGEYAQRWLVFAVTHLDRIESATWYPQPERGSGRHVDLTDTPPPDFLKEREPSAWGEPVLEGPGRTTDPATGEILAQR